MLVSFVKLIEFKFLSNTDVPATIHIILYFLLIVIRFTLGAGTGSSIPDSPGARRRAAPLSSRPAAGEDTGRGPPPGAVDRSQDVCRIVYAAKATLRKCFDALCALVMRACYGRDSGANAVHRLGSSRYSRV